MSTVDPSPALSGDTSSRLAARPAQRARGLLTFSGYALAAACLTAAYALREQNLLRAEDGLGYCFGVAGASLMGLLLLYPVRKRVKAMRRLGPVSLWFRVHMLFGVIGPLLIVLHSNFRVGSFNGRIALFATLLVAGSGIIGRYIYAKLHHGLYGQKASLEELRANVQSLRGQSEGSSGLLPEATHELTALEARLLTERPGVTGAFLRALTIVPQTRWLRRRIRRAIRSNLQARAQSSRVVAEHRHRLQTGADRHADRRIAALRKFAQYRAFQTLFSLWHVVHYPLFVILVIAVIVHVLAVHMY